MIPAARFRTGFFNKMLQQRMLKNGAKTNLNSTSPTIVDTWTPDSVFPANISGNAIACKGSGLASIRFRCDKQANTLSGEKMYVYKNGASRGQYNFVAAAAEVSDVCIDDTLVDNDLIAAYAATGNASYPMKINGTTSWAEIIPINKNAPQCEHSNSNALGNNDTKVISTSVNASPGSLILVGVAAGNTSGAACTDDSGPMSILGTLANGITLFYSIASGTPGAAPTSRAISYSQTNFGTLGITAESWTNVTGIDVAITNSSASSAFPLLTTVGLGSVFVGFFSGSGTNTAVSNGTIRKQQLGTAATYSMCGADLRIPSKLQVPLASAQSWKAIGVWLTGAEQRPLATQYMNKSGTFAAGTTGRVTGWARDTTYTCNIVSDTMRVFGSSPNGGITAVLTGGTGNGSSTLELRINGVTVATSTNVINSGTSATLTYSGPLNDGDTVDVWVTAYTGNGRSITSGYIGIAPL